MNCPKCKKDDPVGREMCPYCGAPIKPIPVPPNGKIRFGKYDWYILDKQPDRMLILTEKVIEMRSPAGNAQSVAGVGGFVGDGFDHGELNIGNADILIDGHFRQNGCGWLSKEDSSHTMNGVRPALWLKNI